MPRAPWSPHSHTFIGRACWWKNEREGPTAPHGALQSPPPSRLVLYVCAWMHVWVAACRVSRDPRFLEGAMPKALREKHEEAARKRYAFVYDDMLPGERSALQDKLKVRYGQAAMQLGMKRPQAMKQCSCTRSTGHAHASGACVLGGRAWRELEF